MTALTPSQRRALCLLLRADISDARLSLAPFDSRVMRALLYLRELHFAVLLTSGNALDWMWRITAAGWRYLAETGWV
jgi:hypothetical protein